MTRPANAALATLIILNIVMLGALLAQIAPHPPKATPLFGIGPYFAACISAAAVAMILGSVETKWGRIFCVIAAAIAVFSFGPQKYFDVQFSLIWPAVLCGQGAMITLFYTAFTSAKRST